MKNGALKVWTTQLAQKIEEELKTETDTDRVCALLDAREYLRRAYHVLDYSPFEPNDTTVETRAFIHKGECLHLSSHTEDGAIVCSACDETLAP